MQRDRLRALFPLACTFISSNMFNLTKKRHVKINKVPWHDCTSLNARILTWNVEVAHLITNSLAWQWVDSSTFSMFLFNGGFTSSDKQLQYWHLSWEDCFLLDKFFYSYNEHERHLISFLLLCTFLVRHSPLKCDDSLILETQELQVNGISTSYTMFSFNLTLIFHFVSI